MDAPPKRSKELLNAVHEDFMRQAVDSAKKRAVAQGVDYDAFKNMVAAAHLKPIQAITSTMKVQALPAWKLPVQRPLGPCPHGCPATLQTSPAGYQQHATADVTSSTCSDTSSHLPSSCQQSTGQTGKQQLPRNSMEFAREWRRLKSSAQKYHFLRRMGAAHLQQVFKADISSELLADILRTLWQCWQQLQSTGVTEAGPPEQQGNHGSSSSHGTALHPASGGHCSSTAAQGHTAGAGAGEGGGGGTAAAAAAAAGDLAVGGAPAAPMPGAAKEAAFIGGVLQQLAGAGRFSLAAQLLDRPVKALTLKLIHGVTACDGVGVQVRGDQLCQLYHVK